MHNHVKCTITFNQMSLWECASKCVKQKCLIYYKLLCQVTDILSVCILQLDCYTAWNYASKNLIFMLFL